MSWTRRKTVHTMELGADSAALQPLGHIVIPEQAGYLSKGVVSGTWLTAMHQNAMGMSRAGSCYVYPLTGGEAALIEKSGILDLCAYKDGKVLLLCQGALALELAHTGPRHRPANPSGHPGRHGGRGGWPITPHGQHLSGASRRYMAVNRQGKAEQGRLPFPGGKCAGALVPP